MSKKWMTPILAAMLVAGCSGENGNTAPPEQSSKPAQDIGQSDAETPAEDEAQKDSDVENEQKEMALQTLRDLIKEAKTGKAYSPNSEFTIGKTTRDEVYKRIGEPEQKENGYDRYTGSMGNPSLAFAYDEKGVMKEARYFGTNVERQTNLGGITTEDLTDELGKPVEIRPIEATGEQNYIYHTGDFELQFVIGKDGTPDHVNLKSRQ